MDLFLKKKKKKFGMCFDDLKCLCILMGSRKPINLVEGANIFPKVPSYRNMLVYIEILSKKSH